MQDFVHIHVHTQYSILDGQASVKKLVDKAIANKMKGIAITDHGNMLGIKEFTNYVNKKNDAVKSNIKKIEAKITGIESGEDNIENKEATLAEARKELEETKGKLFKPIIGCEMYVAHRSMIQKESDKDQGSYHLIVLAKNEKGYHNLIKLVSRAFTKGFYYKPRTDRSELEKYHEGLIVSSACLGGEIPRNIRAGRFEEAEKTIQWYHNLFGDDFYLEMQRHKATVERANHETFGEQQLVNKKLIEYSKKFGIKLICTNDVHFVNEEDAEAHDRLICLSTGKDLEDPHRMLYTKQEWMKTKEEMNEIFADVPEALSNTLDIFNKVEYYSINHPPIMPTFAIPLEFGTEEEYRKKYTEKDLFDEFTCDEHGNVVMQQKDAEGKIKKLGGYEKLYRIKLEADYLKKLAFDGAKNCYGDPVPDEIKERLIFELHVMKTMGFPGYFLIVQDFINAARKELGVSVGPGRGSAAGSAVAYCLGITKIDPVKYDLLFERFLNPDRISLPDIDVDFDDEGRGKVLNWVTQKYGQEKVAHIITYGTMAAKMAIKDVARVEKLPLSESNALAKFVPDKIPGKKNVTLKDAIEIVPELQAAEASNDQLVSETMKYAQMLEGNVRGTGVHACGTIICRDDITDWVPVCLADDKETGEKLLVTQYEGSVIEDTGLIKMDFLGLKTLSIIKEAVDNVKLSRGIDIDIDKIDIEDAATYQLYCEGQTIGTFQFESAGMQKYLRELQPSTFEDLIAMNALYRPGPMDYIPDFIDRKLGRKPIVYDIPIMEKYLKDTYGITVYQEQVMLLSRLLAGFTRGESDTLRKAMGKKLKDKLDHLKPKFIAGGQKNGYQAKTLEKIWADWEKFASYAFNKSHATCYSWVAYQTAYLKAHYPAEYMAAVISQNLSDMTKITKFMDECKSMGISVLGPDVNESNLNFTVNKAGNIRFGLGAIKGVGEKAVQAIIDERQNNGAFKSVADVVQRVNLNACNKKNMENLALAGAFDGFGLRREQYFVANMKDETFLETLVRYGNLYQVEKDSMANSLFGGSNMVETAVPEAPKEFDKWSDLEKLNKERELIGIYLSSHPLDEYQIVLDYMCNTKLAALSDLTPLKGQDLTMGGIVTKVRNGITKNGKPYGIAKVEDYSGAFEFALFGEDWAKYQGNFSEGVLLYISARCQGRQWRPDDLEVKIAGVRMLSEVLENEIERITMSLPLENVNALWINDLTELTEEAKGKTKLSFQITDQEDNMTLVLNSKTVTVQPGKDLVAFVKSHPNVSIQIN